MLQIRSYIMPRQLLRFPFNRHTSSFPRCSYQNPYHYPSILQKTPQLPPKKSIENIFRKQNPAVNNTWQKNLKDLCSLANFGDCCGAESGNIILLTDSAGTITATPACFPFLLFFFCQRLCYVL